MAATAAANNWNQLHGMWGKRRRRTPTWNKMSSAWGKSMYNTIEKIVNLNFTNLFCFVSNERKTINRYGCTDTLE